MDQVEHLWHLTIIRAHGLRRTKPSHPVVTVTLVETGQTFETFLDWDGRNSKTGIPHILKRTTPEDRLDVKVWLRDKQNSESHLVGFARILLKSVARKAVQNSASNEVVVQFKRTPTCKDGTQLGELRANGASVTLRLLPYEVVRSIQYRPVLVDSATSSASSAGGTESNYLSDSSTTTTPEIEGPPPYEEIPQALRKRRIRRRGYCLNPSHEDGLCSSDDSGGLATPVDDSPGETSTETPLQFEDLDEALRILPQFCDEQSISDSLSIAESVLSRVSPYHEMMDDRCDLASVLSRLTQEWYAVGASLLAIIGLNVTVFGYSSDSLTTVNSLEIRTITVGSITASIGLAVDAWLLARYSGVDPETFQRRARDLNDTFFYFWFLLVIAWNAWSTAVLVVCGVAGTFLTLQYLIYGIGSLIGLIAGLVRAAVCGVRQFVGRQVRFTVPPTDSSRPSST